MSLLPHISWTNAGSFVFVKVHVAHAQNVQIECKETILHFSCASIDLHSIRVLQSLNKGLNTQLPNEVHVGNANRTVVDDEEEKREREGTKMIGRKNRVTYAFDYTLFADVVPSKCSFTVKGSYVDIKLMKVVNREWKFFTSDGNRAKISIDWDRGDFDDGIEDEEEKEKVEARKRVEAKKDYDKSQTRIKEYENLMTMYSKSSLGLLAAGDIKTGYLLAFNLTLGICWAFVWLTLVLGVAKVGFILYATEMWREVGGLIKLLQSVVILESVHAAFGLVKSNFLGSLGFFLGRNIVLFLAVDGISAASNRESPILLLIFLAWSLCDAIRFLYLSVSSLTAPFYFLKFLRYTLPVLTFPIVASMEAYLEYTALYEPSLAVFNINLPNQLNFGFDAHCFLAFALLLHIFFCFPMFQLLLKQRSTQLSKNEDTIEQKKVEAYIEKLGKLE